MFSPPLPAPSSGLAIGLDLGTSGMKAVALDSSGVVVARASAGYPTSRPEAGASEQEPTDWLSAIGSVAAEIRAQTNNAEWAVIGLSGMIPTLVTVDASGQPTGPAITWEDARAEAEGDALRAACGAHELYALTGQWVDGRYLLPMLHRLAQVDSARVDNSTMLLSAKDYLYLWLTGRAATDPSTATGFGAYDLQSGTWDQAVLDTAASLSAARSAVGSAKPRRLAGSLALPEVLPSQHCEPLTSVAAHALDLIPGIPVCLGAADSVLGAIGMGVTSPGDIAYVGGTSTIVLGVTDRIVLDEQHRFLVTPMTDSDHWGLEMDLLATGAAFRWLAAILGVTDEAALLSLATRASEDVPLFLPYVAPGEQGALWDPHLTGTLHGLHVGHTAADIAQALVAGIVVESRRCLRTLESHGFRPDCLRVSGGSASDPWFRQQLADATGHVIITSGGSDTDRSAAGAAVLASEALGRGARPPNIEGERSSPDSTAALRWDHAAQRHDLALARIRGLS